ncbi:NADH-quinone oxidoreductase subunit N [Constrictibacter sp. MBR-5]|jgi:NADH-quinone oxidoreductase subunit N|uniref:NADH-quinone oxidoreductase subunit NuoN n=1 Tax=Constrictibacter sp. MBR-5 TaxID=3156467 RepID=UPI003392C0ED
MSEFINVAAAVPEIFMAIAAMGMLMYGVFKGEGAARSVSWIAVAVLAVTAGLLLIKGGNREVAFAGLFVIDQYAVFAKLLILLGSALAILMAVDFNEREGTARFEYPIIAVIATLGMMMMVSANDLMSLYIGLELQSLSLYILAAFRRDSLKSTEAGLKYFVLGALSSGMLLYGASLVYGFSGTTSFDGLAQVFASNAQPSIGVIVGIVFVAAGLAFKVSAVPFHMWTPDVYEGAPTPVTAFFAVAPKIAAVALFVRVLMGPFADLVDQWQQIVWVISVGSMLIGSFAAIAQTNIKRLMAYSSIGHVGYAFVGLAAGTEIGVRGVLIYMALYLFMNIGAFACILAMRQKGRMVEEIGDLAGLSRTHPMVAAAFAALMFSMAGIPPLAGFFGKLYVFLAAIEAGLIVLAVIGVLTSVVSCYYYLRIVKLMYFDEVVEPFDHPLGRGLGVPLAISSIVTILFILYPTPITSGAAAAAAALVGG